MGGKKYFIIFSASYRVKKDCIEGWLRKSTSNVKKNSMIHEGIT
jgi:hypothetical protein